MDIKRIKNRLDNLTDRVKNSDLEKSVNDAKAKIESIISNPKEYMLEFIMQIKLAYDMLVCYKNHECDMPWKTVAALLGVVLYFINPFDVMPDFIPGIGYIDDLAALGITFKIIQEDLKKYADLKNIDLKKYGIE